MASVVFAMTIGITALAGARGGSGHDIVNAARVETFTAAVAADDMLATEGFFTELPLVTLVCRNFLPLCQGNNSANPYMAAIMLDAGAPRTLPAVLTQAHLQFKLRADEAVVLIGKTPPPLNYFSYTPFIYSRYFKEEGITRKMFVSVIDPLNQGVLNLLGRKDDPYDQPVVIIFTADKRIAHRVERALLFAGFPHAIINLAALPSALAVFSTPTDVAHGDSFVIAERMGTPLPGTDLAPYLNNRGENLHTRIFRITPKDYDERLLQPLAVPPVRPRGTGYTELELAREQRQMRDTLLRTYAAKGYTGIDLNPSVWLEESYGAIQQGLDTLGESADTPYLKSEDFGLAGDDFVVAYGANHAATGKATYSNANLYEKCAECGLYSAGNAEMKGSAAAWLPANNRNASKMYVHMFSRACNDLPTCTTVTADTCPSMDTGMYVGFRAYYEPDTLVGPAHRELLWDRAILFTRTPVVISNVTQVPAASSTIAPGSTADIGFNVSGPASSQLKWTATLTRNARCGSVDPKEGWVSSGARVSFTFHSCKGPDEAEILIGAVDEAGRPAQSRGVVVTVGAP